MKKDLITLGALLLTVALLFGISMLLDVEWVHRNIARQIIVYLMMALTLFVACKVIIKRYN